MAAEILQSMIKIFKEAFGISYEIFSKSFKEAIHMLLSPYKHILKAKKGTDYEQKDYLVKSDNEKLYNDWKTIDDDLRKAIKSYAR